MPAGGRGPCRQCPTTSRSPPGYGLNAAAIDRLTLNPKRLERRASRRSSRWHTCPTPSARSSRSSRRPNGLDVTPGPRAARRRVHDLREPAERHGRRRRPSASRAATRSSSAAARKRSTRTARCTGSWPTSCVEAGLPAAAVQLVATTDRAAVGHLLRLPELIDLAIPRGGESLIRRVADEARMPVLKHYTGNCHVYVDAEPTRRWPSAWSSTPRPSAPASATPRRRCWCTARSPRAFLPTSPQALAAPASSSAATTRAARLVRR